MLCPESSAKAVLACWSFLRGGRGAYEERKGPPRRPPSGGLFYGAQQLFLVFSEVRHVEVARGLQPVLAGLHRKRQFEPPESRSPSGFLEGLKGG